MKKPKKPFIRPEVTVMDVQSQSLLAASDPEVSGAKAQSFTMHTFNWGTGELN